MNTFMSIISEDKNDTFFNKIKSFQQLYDLYQNDKDEFHEGKLVQICTDLTIPRTKNPKQYQSKTLENWCKSVIILLKVLSEKNNLILFNNICCSLINFTDKSDWICESMVQSGLTDILIEMYLNINDNLKDKKSTRLSLVNILNLTHNIARHVHLQQFFLQHPKINQFKQLICHFSMDSSDDVSIVATFVRIWLDKEDGRNSDLIAEDVAIIKKIFRYIKKTFLKEKIGITGWSLSELLEGLQALSSNSGIKDKIMMEDEFVEILIKIITSITSSSKEIELSLGTLWNLSFVEGHRSLLNTDYNIELIIEPLVKNDCKSIRTIAKGLLWDLKDKPSKLTSTRNEKYDIFLSYSHAQKDLVSKIERQLKKEFTVWIDKDNIKGSSLDDMAWGIERSKVVVICVSNSYKQSQFCHSEANYAYQNKKPIIPLIMEHKYKPDGWLGIIISSEFYIDVSDKATFLESIEKLNEALKYKGLTGSTLEDNAERKMPTTTRPYDFRDWNILQFSEWLKDNGLNGSQLNLERFDGAMIDALLNMKIECPLIYYDSLENKLHLTFEEILKLSSALSKLN